MKPHFPPVRSQALSPVSAVGSEWSGINGYGAVPRSQSPFSPQNSLAVPSEKASGNPANVASDGGPPAALPRSARRPSASASQLPSPTFSAANARSSDGTLSDQQSIKYKRMEEQLCQHYDVLKRYLNGGQQPSPRPNKGRDKLLRLSATQFHELSTDIYDELTRRQAASNPRPPPGRAAHKTNVPPYLLPRSDFHEKRNQARQKLSSLQPQRFRDLATDVFCELERRFPHFKRPIPSRQRSPGSNASAGYPSRGPTPSGLRPSPPLARGPGSRTTTASQMSNTEADQAPRPDSEYGKPMPKHFQSSTMTPNKSTMVEDDEDDFAVDDDPQNSGATDNAVAPESPSLSSGDPAQTTTAAGAAEADAATREILEEAQAKVLELNCRVDELQVDLSLKDDEIVKLKEAEQNANRPPDDWSEVKQQLEKQLEDAEMLNQSMKDQLDRIHTDQAAVERDLRSQLDRARRPPASDGGWKVKHEQLEKEHHALQAKLQEQQRVTEEVRQQASGFLQEMRTMADSGGGASGQREQELSADVRRLEEQVQQWQSRYARTKAQLRNLRATSVGLSMSRPDVARQAKAPEFTRSDGLVKDVYVTKFQMAIDELLRISRADDPSAVLDHMKTVVLAVRGITNGVDDDVVDDAPSGHEAAQQHARLKSKVSATANNVITAGKNFAASNGLSPVSLLDAAASHLTTAVVELVRVVKIRPTPPEELDEDDATVDEAADGDRRNRSQSPTYFQVEARHLRTSSGHASVYSSVSEPSGSNGSSTSHSVHNGRSDSKTDSGSTDATTFGDIDGPGSEGGEAESGARAPDNGAVEELKLYLDDHTNTLVRSIQTLVGSIRAEAAVPDIRQHMATVTAIVADVIGATEDTTAGSAALGNHVSPVLEKLTRCHKRLSNATAQSEKLGSDPARNKQFMSRVPPVAFEIARVTKELVQQIDAIGGDDQGGDLDDYS